MADSIPVFHSSAAVQAPQSIAGHAAGAKGSVVGGEGALAFKALLDQLDERARALETESQRDLTQDDLAGAIGNARASLEQMLSLKDQLLEAWRAAQAQSDDAVPPRA